MGWGYSRGLASRVGILKHEILNPKPWGVAIGMNM